MQRYHLILEYDGTAFSGWQRQRAGIETVQGAIEAAGAALTGGARSPCIAAGRTDAGVHALKMSAHIDLVRKFDARTVQRALNAHLRPRPVAILHAAAVPETFHARFSCIRRHYLYRLTERSAPLVLAAGRLWQRPYMLDLERMQKAALPLIGKHDFTTFRAAACQAHSPVKTLEAISISRQADEIHIRCAAPSFLHHQIRSLVGTLERVGAGRWAIEDVEAALRARDRAACGPVAPAHGLYFDKAMYQDGG